jgi:hypothetical protein
LSLDKKFSQGGKAELVGPAAVLAFGVSSTGKLGAGGTQVRWV